MTGKLPSSLYLPAYRLTNIREFITLQQLIQTTIDISK
jgi:hypothetical protein